MGRGGDVDGDVDPYEVLGLASGIDFGKDGENVRLPSSREISRAYRKMALKYHPDKNTGNARAAAMFQKVKDANEALQDSKKRKEFEQKYRAKFARIAKRRKLDEKSRKMRGDLEVREKKARDAARAVRAKEDEAALIARLREENLATLETLRYENIVAHKKKKAAEEEKIKKAAKQAEVTWTDRYIAATRASLNKHYPQAAAAFDDGTELPYLNREEDILASLVSSK